MPGDRPLPLFNPMLIWKPIPPGKLSMEKERKVRGKTLHRERT